MPQHFPKRVELSSSDSGSSSELESIEVLTDTEPGRGKVYRVDATPSESCGEDVIDDEEKDVDDTDVTEKDDEEEDVESDDDKEKNESKQVGDFLFF